MLIKNFIHTTNSFLKIIGFDFEKLIYFFRGLPFYFRDYFNLKKSIKTTFFPFGKFYPMLNDRFESSGIISFYTIQDLFIARCIFENNPIKHLDIGSRIDGFVTHVAVFRKIEVFDIRPLVSWDKNIIYKQADLMILSEELINEYDSISSLHAIEHFGLGRYSDPIDADGHIKAVVNIYQMLKVGGLFYFSVPIGRQRIEFNAHRVFSLSYLLELFQGKFEIKRYSYINDKGDFFENVMLDENLIKNNCFCTYGCGIFELKCVK